MTGGFLGVSTDIELREFRAEVGNLPCQAKSASAMSLAWAKGLGVRRIWPAVNAPPLALDYRPRPLLRPAMPRGEFDELLEVGTLALARPEEPDRSRYAQVQHRDLLDRRYLEMGGNK
jgi:hypothetical protein